jgi:hypothetical protein
MKELSVTFSLDIRPFDARHVDDEGVVLETPMLGIYYSADAAAADREGLEIVETLDGSGDLWFFASDGSPLAADFSKEHVFSGHVFTKTRSCRRRFVALVSEDHC